jgi:hypothetical protein
MLNCLCSRSCGPSGRVRSLEASFLSRPPLQLRSPPPDERMPLLSGGGGGGGVHMKKGSWWRDTWVDVSKVDLRADEWEEDEPIEESPAGWRAYAQRLWEWVV